MTTEQDFIKNLSDPRWRVVNLYKIKDKNKQIILFKPNAAQQKLIDDLHWRNIIPKARQRGFSTLIQILALDTALFTAGSDVGIIAQDLDTAQDIFDSKIKLAYDHLPETIRKLVPAVSWTTRSIKFSNGSKVRVGTSMRGGTLNFLHVSEFGKICAKYPQKAKEIMTGTIPALPNTGLLFIESTSEGRGGQFHKLVEEAKKDQDSGKELSPISLKLHFAGWWDADEYEIAVYTPVLPELDVYFDSLESKLGIKIKNEKRWWYCTMLKNTFTDDWELMKQEYPATVDEAFEVSVSGAYYTPQLTALRKAGRIKQAIPKVDGVAAYTFWDIGSSDGTAIWVIQKIGMDWVCINFIEGWGEPYSYYVQELQKLGLVYNTMFLPHDATHKRQGQKDNKSPQQMLEELMPGVRFEIVPRIEDISWGIQQMRKVFPLLVFDESRTLNGLKHLEQYRRKWNAQQDRWNTEPDKTGGHSEAADALRQFAQAYENGQLNVSCGTINAYKRKNKGNWRTV